MMNEERDIELLEKYLREELGETDRASLEQRLQQESDLMQLLNDVKLLTAGVRQSGRTQLKEELEQIESSLPQVGGHVVFWRTPWAMGIAASVLLILLAYWLWPKPVSSEELFAQYFEPYPNVIMPTVRGDLEPDTTLMAKAYRAYDQGKYEEAIRYFEQVSEKDEGVYLYLGNSYLATNEAEKAITCFEKVLNDYDVFDEQAEWYLGLSNLQLRDLDHAKENFKNVIQKSSPYALKAKSIINQI